mgnify:CR=1 FL=1
MDCFIGIDLGSTTTKAVVMDDNLQVLGRGITNSRSNYDVAAEVAKQEFLDDGGWQEGYGYHQGDAGESTIEILETTLDASPLS